MRKGGKEEKEEEIRRKEDRERKRKRRGGESSTEKGKRGRRRERIEYGEYDYKCIHNEPSIINRVITNFSLKCLRGRVKVFRKKLQSEDFI